MAGVAPTNADLFLGGTAPTTAARTDYEAIVMVCAPADRAALKTANLRSYLALKESAMRGLTSKFEFVKFKKLTDFSSKENISGIIEKTKELF